MQLHLHALSIFKKRCKILVRKLEEGIKTLKFKNIIAQVGQPYLWKCRKLCENSTSIYGQQFPAHINVRPFLQFIGYHANCFLAVKPYSKMPLPLFWNWFWESQTNTVQMISVLKFYKCGNDFIFNEILRKYFIKKFKMSSLQGTQIFVSHDISDLVFYRQNIFLIFHLSHNILYICIW